MRSRILPLALGLLVAMTVAVTAGAATADAAKVRLSGVSTKLMTDPATTGVLIHKGIVPLPVRPASVWPVSPGGHAALAYRFPITGGRVDADTLAGKISHSGGLRFVNLSNFHTLKLTDFRIVTKGEPRLTAIVNDDPSARVRILDLDLSPAEIKRMGRIVRINGVDATLTQVAADALNATLGVSFFAEGIDLGDAYVTARVAR